MSCRLIILSNDTECGKTWLSCELLRRAHKEDFSLAPFKPVASGDRGDSLRLAEAAGSRFPWQEVNPIFFQPPLAPYAASIIEDNSLDWNAIEQSLSSLSKKSDALLIETAGGILTPFDPNTAMCDLVSRWTALPIFVIPNKLGTITQCRSALEVLRHRAITPFAVVLNSLPTPDLEHDEQVILDMTRSSNAALLSEFFPHLSFYSSAPQDLDQLWLRLKAELTSPHHPPTT